MSLGTFCLIIAVIMWTTLVVIGFLVFIVLKFLKNVKLQDINTSLLLQQDKILKLIEKANQVNSSRFKNLEDTVGNIGNTTLNIINDLDLLTKQVIEDFSEIHCEMSDHDCDVCLFKDKCPILHQVEQDDYSGCFSSEVTSSSNEENPSSVGCEKPSSIEVVTLSGESKFLDLNTEGYKALYSLLLEQGVPEPVISVYLGQLKDIVKARPGCSIKLAMSKTPNLDQSTMTTNPESESKIAQNEEKLISPNSKIIKTLEKLFHSND